jgi:hypothetical protein
MRQARERTMQQLKQMTRLNQMALAAFLIGVCGFIYDASTDGPSREIAERVSAPAETAELSLAAYAPASSRATLIVD